MEVRNIGVWLLCPHTAEELERFEDIVRQKCAEVRGVPELSYAVNEGVETLAAKVVGERVVVWVLAMFRLGEGMGVDVIEPADARGS